MALVIVDIDGTLLQTKLVTVPAVQRTFARWGLPVPDEGVICSFFGQPVHAYLDWLSSLCPSGHLSEIVEQTNALELELIASEGRLYDGAYDALRQLHAAGHVLAVCSNGPSNYVNAFLAAHKVACFFAHVAIPELGFSNKTEMVRDIIDRFSDRPVFMIGDRGDDMRAAHDNGAIAIGAGYGFGSGDADFGLADRVVSSANQIVSVITELLA